MTSVAHNYFYQTSECIALSCIAAALALEYFLPMPITWHSVLWRLMGIALVLGAVAILFWCQYLFRESGETTKPGHSTNVLLVSGPYRWSRNPIYAAVVSLILGIGLTSGRVWICISALAAVWLIRRVLIVPEEIYLEERFNGSYLEYKKRVRCWI